MKGDKVFALIFPRVVMSSGIAVISIAVFISLLIGDLVNEGYGILTMILIMAIVLLKLFDKKVESRLLESMYPVYRLTIKMLLLSVLFAIFNVLTKNDIFMAFYLLYLSAWLTEIHRKNVGVRLLFGGFLFLWGISQAYLGSNIKLLYLFMLFGSGFLTLLYGIQYSFRREFRPATAFSDIVEIILLIMFFSFMPVLFALIAVNPFQSYFDEVLGRYQSIQTPVQLSEEIDLSLLINAGILIFLLVMLVIVWKKISERSKSDQKNLDEQMAEVFGRSRSLNIEHKKRRRFPSSYRGQVIALYWALIDFLEKSGIPKRASDTPEEFSRVLEQKEVVMNDDMISFTHMYLAARFSTLEIGENDFLWAKDKYGVMRKAAALREYRK